MHRGIEELRVARKSWTIAHFPEEKQEALRVEREARGRLRRTLDLITPGESDWLDQNFLSPSAPPAEHDIRDLFPAPAG